VLVVRIVLVVIVSVTGFFRYLNVAGSGTAFHLARQV